MFSGAPSLAFVFNFFCQRQDFFSYKNGLIKGRGSLRHEITDLAISDFSFKRPWWGPSSVNLLPELLKVYFKVPPSETEFQAISEISMPFNYYDSCEKCTCHK